MKAKILGQVIGTAEEIEDVDSNVIFFFRLKLNQLGNLFIPTFNPGSSLWIDFITGETGYTETEDSEEIPVKLNWGVFSS